ncbi:MAG: hypothetical protein JSV96_00340, partial [Candidatus Aminicenantes bacterium]
LIITLKHETGTHIDNFRYSIIKDAGLSTEQQFFRRIDNRIFNNLLTQRKKKKIDELFYLTNDIAMEKNLIQEDRYKPMIKERKKQIYAAFKYYLQREERLTKGNKVDLRLSEEDKRILRSLGYLI